MRTIRTIKLLVDDLSPCDRHGLIDYIIHNNHIGFHLSVDTQGCQDHPYLEITIQNHKEGLESIDRSTGCGDLVTKIRNYLNQKKHHVMTVYMENGTISE